ncbi:piezo-type mechanosensitive ion channel component 1-like isoform X9 [Apostichopus japonicus]|uniref:piezo-type mechanosensitive ion channel component 1-like isoform X9 n=1 Tax=Stichopus japonicus TaxID=307972 RepID=UPI003AB59316
MVNIGIGVAAFLFKWILPCVILAASVARINAVSGVYLLCFLLLPLMPNPTRITLQGRTGIYLKVVTILGAIACLLQTVFQIVIYTTDIAQNLEFCEANESLWRQLGFQRLDGVTFVDGLRLVAPDAVVFLLTIVIFVASKKLVGPSPDDVQRQGVVMERRPRKHSQVAEGITCFITMALLAAAGIIVPSAISSVYFLSLLIVATWWALYMTWGRVFNVLQLVWLIYSGAHIILLYLYQFQFFQEEIDPSEFVARLVGLTSIVDAECTPGVDPRAMAFVKGQIWPIYANPGVLFLFYWYVGLQVRSWMDGPQKGDDTNLNEAQNGKANGDPKEPVMLVSFAASTDALLPTDSLNSEYVESPRSPKKKKNKKKKKGELEDTQERGLMDATATSYQSMGESSGQAAAAAAEGGGAGADEESPPGQTPASGDEGDESSSYKLSPLTTIVAYITKQSYMVALIFMMAWSIIFLSVLSFVLLVWALAIWVLPIGTMRGRCLWTSLPLVLYAEALTCITFVYGFQLEEELPDKVNGINLTEIGFLRVKYQCLILAGELIFTLIFWLTLRQFLRERCLKKVSTSNEGIVLQPFGVIFSEPREEIDALSQNSRQKELSQSETMTVVGQHIRRFSSKYWIFLVGAFFLIMTLVGHPDVFKIVYLLFFLALVNLFVLSFTLFRVFSGLICWIVVIYSMCCLLLIYSYQFEYAPELWENITNISPDTLESLGLQQYNIAELFINLLIPVVFIVVIMMQLHYFHSEFLKRTQMNRSGYSPRQLKETPSSSHGGRQGRQSDGDDQEGVNEAAEEEQGEGDEGTSGDATDKAAKKKSKSWMKNWFAAKWRQGKKLYNPATVALWRFVEIHIAKIVLFTIFFVATDQITFFNGVLILIIFLAILFPLLMRLLSLGSLFWVSIVMLAKMVYQINLIADEVNFPECDDESIMFKNVTSWFTIQWANELMSITTHGNGSTLVWIGLEKVDNFSSYVGGYVGIIVIIIAQSVVWLHQRQYRKENGLEEPKYSVVFFDITRDKADEGLISCSKFLINYAFYKFGLEICFLFTVITTSVRLDVYGVIFMLLMVMMLFLRRQKVAILWPFYALCLVVLLLLAYALSLGLPPALCYSYPWAGLDERLVEWLYLPDYANPPTGKFILTDFIQLLLVCLQWDVFRLEKRPEGIQGGGDNYEASTDVENIAENPVPNFNIKRTYLNILKILIFNFNFWVTLAIVYLAGTLRISLLGFIYIILAFIFLWGGADFLMKPTLVKMRRWNVLLGYCVFVILAKVGLQLMTCVFSHELAESGHCWVVQLFGVVCFQTGYIPPEDECNLPADSARMTWDIVCFIFILIQRRIFSSNYFQYVVLDLQEEGKLSSKGAELINEILATKVRNNRLKEQRILENVKRKMAKIRDNQAKLAHTTGWIEPKTHGEALEQTPPEAIRGQGGYYMFEDLSDEELSDMEEIGIIDTEEKGPEGQQTAAQLAFQGITQDPEKALELDDKRRAEVKDQGAGDDDADAVSYSTAHEEDTGMLDPSTDSARDEDEEGPTPDELQDDVPMGAEAEPEEEIPPPEGMKAKILVKVKWIWRILMRIVDTVISWLDELSKEYRYVHRELRKIKLEAKRQRTTQKPAVIDEGTSEEAAEPSKEDGEEGTPKDETRVTIVEPPEVERSGESGAMGQSAESEEEKSKNQMFGFLFKSTERKEEVASVTATSSTTKFERSMIRPLRLLYALFYAIISHSEILCFFLIIINHIVRANLLSMPLVIALFLWALLCIPRPTRRFWIFILTYEMVIVMYKYVFQFSFYPWNSEANLAYNEGNTPLWPPEVFGMVYTENFSVLDLCLLLAVFFHRSILKSHGLWTESQVVPDLGQNEGKEEEEDEESKEENEDDQDKAAKEDMEKQKKKDKKKKKKDKKDKKKKKKDKKKSEEDEETEAADGDTEDAAAAKGGDEEGAAVGEDGEPIQREESEEEEEKEEESETESLLAPLKRFYQQMVDPTFSATTDVYVVMFLLQFIMFIVLALFNHAFGEEKAASDVTELVDSNNIPTSFLVLLLIQFFVIVIDRAIYLRKNVTAKFIFLLIWVIVIHLWLFFILPPINNKPFTENTPARWFYFLNCVYFGLSCYQIRSGYPTRILGNFLYKRYSYASLVMFYGWKAIPFLAELRLIMDWVWTDTTLSLFHYAKIEDIYSNIYPDKCFRRNEKNMPTPRGQMQKAAVKYGMGGGMVLGLIFIIWFPLIFVSFANTVSIANPPQMSEISVSFSGYQPIFTSFAQMGSLAPLSKQEYNKLVEDFDDDLEARTFLTLYRQEDFIKITYSGESGTTWEVSPPSRESFENELNSNQDVIMTFRYTFTRITGSELVTPTVGGEVQITLSPTDEADRKIRDGLAAMLNLSATNDPVLIPKLFPKYVRVPLTGMASSAEKILPDGENSNASLLLNSGAIAGLSNTVEWWDLFESEDDKTIVIITLNDRTASQLLAPLAGYGIIGLYVSLVLVIGRFVRMMFSGISYTIMFDELPNVDRILKLVLDIYLVRESGEMELEEDLTARLFFLYRSPETLIKVTKDKQD